MAEYFIVPYVRDPSPRTGPWFPGVTLAINIDAPELEGLWDYLDVGAGYALVKIKSDVKIDPAQLDKLYKRLPSNDLKTELDTVPSDEKNELRQILLDMKYEAEEVDERFPRGFQGQKLEAVVKFMASRRRLLRYDQEKDEHIFDGQEITEDPKKVDELDRKLNGIRG